MGNILKLVGTLSLLFLRTYSAMSSGPRVAIVGGGISGLSCARRLQTLGIDATVFDTGKKATGGRCSSRSLLVDGQTHIVDHSSQFFTATSESFKGDLENFKRDGSIIEWKGKLAQISESKSGATEFNVEKTRFVGKNGMASLSKKMSENLDIKKQTWVSKMERNKSNSQKWGLFQYSEFLGYYDVVVIAHNGKCADRLLSTADVPRIHDLLKVTFGDTLPPPNRMRKMQLCSLWVTVFAVRGSLPVPYEGAYVSQSKTLSWICNNTKKMKPPLESSVSSTTGSVCDTAVSIPNEAAVQKEAPLPGKFSYAAAASKVSPTSQLTPITAPKGSKSPSPVAKKGTEVSEVECWTLTSTREFGAANKVPQENVPPEKEREIISLMLRSMELSAGLPSGSIVPIAAKAQLWGAAVPMNRHSAPFLMDGAEGVAVCGDWFSPMQSSSGPSIESAHQSGRMLADAIYERFEKGIKKDVGLEPTHFFQACAAHPLGDVPGSVSAPGARGPALSSSTPASSLLSASKSSSSASKSSSASSSSFVTSSVATTTTKDGGSKRVWVPKK